MEKIDSKIVEELIETGEGQTIDFKESLILSDGFKLARILTSFANTNGGFLLIGVRDDRTLEGLEKNEEHQTKIINIAHDICDPPLTPSIHLYEKGGIYVYVVKVSKFKVYPYSVKLKGGNSYFIRTGDTVRGAHPHELKLLFEDSSEPKIEKKPILVISLLDENDEEKNEITVKPTFTVEKRIKRQNTQVSGFARYTLPKILDFSKLKPMLGQSEEAPACFVPISISIANIGQKPARGVRISLIFPSECELAEEHDFHSLIIHNAVKGNHGGLYNKDKESKECTAWVEVLGNDLSIDSFHSIFVLFPQKEDSYKLKALVTQHEYPVEEFEFAIKVIPNYIEKEVYED